MVAASLASITIGCDEYPLIVEPRCHLCQSPKRREAETLLAQGRTYRAIVEELKLEPEVSARNVSDHYRAGHLPVQAAAVDQMTRQASSEASQRAAPLIQGVVDHLNFAHAVVARVGARLATGETQPTVSDGLAAARLIAQLEGVSTSVDEWTEYFTEIYEAAQDLMTTDQFQAFVRRVGEADVVRRTQLG